MFSEAYEYGIRATIYYKMNPCEKIEDAINATEVNITSTAITLNQKGRLEVFLDKKRKLTPSTISYRP